MSASLDDQESGDSTIATPTRSFHGAIGARDHYWLVAKKRDLRSVLRPGGKARSEAVLTFAKMRWSPRQHSDREIAA
jgi:hypothetical protein